MYHENFNMKSIYNTRDRARADELQGRNNAQILIDRIATSGEYNFRIKINSSDGKLQHFFFAHKKSIELFRRFNTVLLMDCTYKTNKNKMPLLDITGFTSTKKTFLLGVAFLSSDKNEDYTWALNQLQDCCFVNGSGPSVVVTDRDLALCGALETVLPTATHLVCRWHGLHIHLDTDCKQ